MQTWRVMLYFRTNMDKSKVTDASTTQLCWFYKNAYVEFPCLNCAGSFV